MPKMVMVTFCNKDTWEETKAFGRLLPEIKQNFITFRKFKKIKIWRIERLQDSSVGCGLT
jgi:hypothetical protein